MTADVGDITESNRLFSPLLPLTGELQNRIYEYAVGGQDWDFESSDARPVLEYGLLLACRQMYRETSSLHIVGGELKIRDSILLRAWLQGPGAHVAHTVTSPVFAPTETFAWRSTELVPCDIWWWHKEVLELDQLPQLRSVRFLVAINNWENESIVSARASIGMEPSTKLSALAKLFVDRKTTVEAFNPGVDVTVALDHTANLKGWTFCELASVSRLNRELVAR